MHLCSKLGDLGLGISVAFLLCPSLAMGAFLIMHVLVADKLAVFTARFTGKVTF